MAAQPFGAGERGGEREHALGAPHPDQPGGGKTERGIDGEYRRQAGDRER